jgi:hypothetical protein
LRVAGLQKTGPGQFTIGWSTIAGKHYQVQYKPALDAADWLNVGGVVTGNGASAAIDDTPGPVSQRFYRILVLD